MLRRVLRFLDAAIRWLGIVALGIAAVFIALLAAIGAADIFGTALFASPVAGALELSEAGLVIIVFMGLAHAQRGRAHVTVDILTARFTGLARDLSLGLALAAAAAFFGFLAWRSGIAAWESVQIDERSMGASAFPLWPGKIAMWLGCFVAMLESLRQLVHLLLGRPDPEGGHD